MFSRKGLFDNLFEAVSLLKMSDLYESAIEVRIKTKNTFNEGQQPKPPFILFSFG